ncbi:MAG: 30S ribosomal protein THX [Chitinophagaceae bacterium]|nr:30S ribosomal protein THX [Chitinophagaceae bacterium]
MGRGDKRTKRGKITIGSFGNSRKARTATKAIVKPVATPPPAATAAPKEETKKRVTKKKEK